VTAAPASDAGFGVYIHWPYCAAICPYCAFNVVRDRGREAERSSLLDAIVRDLETTRARTGPKPLASLYFGGGTPSRLEPGQVARLVEAATSLWTPADELEVSLEANPDDCSRERLAGFRAAGVGRLSLGVQSFVDGDLQALGRWHSAADARAAVGRALETIPRVSIDLIYARPGQSLEAWEAELGEALTLGVEHVSLYELTIEPGTAFAARARRGEVPPSDDGRGADFLAANARVATAAGYEAYEVSNYAKGPAARSRHNLVYWRSGEWAGVGPGAHGRLGAVGGRRVATSAEPDLSPYVARVGETGSGVAEEEALGPEAQRDEALLMGLRLEDGVELAMLDRIAGAQLDEARMKALEADALVERSGGRLRLRPDARALADRIVLELTR
jgi:oxygen-independent coproporphyrinogen-3 oxidase